MKLVAVNDYLSENTVWLMLRRKTKSRNPILLFDPQEEHSLEKLQRIKMTTIAFLLRSEDNETD